MRVRSLLTAALTGLALLAPVAGPAAAAPYDPGSCDSSVSHRVRVDRFGPVSIVTVDLAQQIDCLKWGQTVVGSGPWASTAGQVSSTYQFGTLAGSSTVAVAPSSPTVRAESGSRTTPAGVQVCPAGTTLPWAITSVTTYSGPFPNADTSSQSGTITC